MTDGERIGDIYGSKELIRTQISGLTLASEGSDSLAELQRV